MKNIVDDRARQWLPICRCLASCWKINEIDIVISSLLAALGVIALFSEFFTVNQTEQVILPSLEDL